MNYAMKQERMSEGKKKARNMQASGKWVMGKTLKLSIFLIH
jgi:hypothetical protein